MERFGEALRTGGTFLVEHRIRSRDGDYRWFLVRAEPHRDPRSGEITHWFGASVDIHDRRQAEAALRESETRLRTALDGGRLGTFEWDLQTDTVRVSQRANEIFGFGPGEGHQPADYFDRIPPDEREQVQAEVAAGLAQERLDTSYHIRLPDGAVRYVTSHGRVLRDANGAPERVVGVFRDETDRERTAQALRESEARLQLALDASGMVGLYDWHVPEDRLFADARFARLFGVDPDRAAAGAPLAEFTRGIHLDDWPHVETAMRHAMETGEHYEAEYRVLKPDGEERWVAARGRAFLNPAGAPLRFSGTVVDITARRRAEERQTLLSREVDHRAKNALFVVQAALRLSRAPDLPSYVRLIEGRVAALARAQTLLAEDRWAGADLRTLLHGELAGFLGTGGGSGQQAVVEGPKVALPPGAAQPFAMAVHELATNAVKYGALSAPGGRVAVTWTLEGGPAGKLHLRWAERGGPPVEGPPSQRGFGTRVLDGTVRGQLGGRSRSPGCVGLACDIEVPLGAQSLHG
jgi:PAS domain S-box-containing protein